MDNKKLTKGQQAVRMSFNPSKDPRIDLIKQKAADLWDLVDQSVDRDPAGHIVGRILEDSTLAKHNIQQASMWAVSAIIGEG